MFGSSESSSARGGHINLNSMFGQGNDIDFIGNEKTPLFIFGGILAVALLLIWGRR